MTYCKLIYVAKENVLEILRRLFNFYYFCIILTLI